MWLGGILIGRLAQGLKDLANPVIGNGYDLQLRKGVRARGQMGRGAGEVQERRVRDRDVAARAAAHHHYGF